MQPEPSFLCIHCDLMPIERPASLCCRCKATASIRRLYLRRRGWTPAWETHLRTLTAKAQQKKSLFSL